MVLCLVDSATTHTILNNKKYFSQMMMLKASVSTILGRAIYCCMWGTELEIIEAL